MHRILLAGIIVGLSLSGCAPQHTDSDVMEAQKIATSQRLLHVWVDCARTSYQNFEPTMRDKNEAAERALQACQSEESDFRQTSPEILFPHTREAVKEILINHEAW